MEGIKLLKMSFGICCRNVRGVVSYIVALFALFAFSKGQSARNARI
jgi:hypothetical protein